jgi:hypothetical protein
LASDAFGSTTAPSSSEPKQHRGVSLRRCCAGCGRRGVVVAHVGADEDRKRSFFSFFSLTGEWDATEFT